MSDTTLVTLRDGCEHHQEMADPAAAALEALRMVRPGGGGDVHGWAPARIESRGVPIWQFDQHDTFAEFVRSLAFFMPHPAPDPDDLEGWFRRVDPEEPYPTPVAQEFPPEGFGEDAPVLPEIPLEHDSFEVLGYPPEMSDEEMEEAMEQGGVLARMEDGVLKEIEGPEFEE